MAIGNDTPRITIWSAPNYTLLFSADHLRVWRAGDGNVPA